MTRRRASLSETALQIHIVKCLQAYGRHDIEWHHVPNGDKRHASVGEKLKTMGVKPGVADLLFLVDSKSFALELKTEIGTQTAVQKEWQETYERAGGKYFIAFGLDQALAILQEMNVFRPGISFTVSSALGGREVRRESAAQCKPALPLLHQGTYGSSFFPATSVLNQTKGRSCD